MKSIGVILAGGKSSRMGEDKALLQLDNGNTLLQHSMLLLEKSGIENVIVSGDRNGGIADRIANLGPLAAIETIIHKVQPQRLLIIPVDMPLLTHTMIKRLLKLDNEESAYFDQHYLPLSLAVTKKTKKVIRHLLELQASKQRSVKNLLSKIPTKIFKVTKNHAFALQNINTPEQWQQLKSLPKRELT